MLPPPALRPNAAGGRDHHQVIGTATLTMDGLE